MHHFSDIKFHCPSDHSKSIIPHPHKTLNQDAIVQFEYLCGPLPSNAHMKRTRSVAVEIQPPSASPFSKANPPYGASTFPSPENTESTIQQRGLAKYSTFTRIRKCLGHGCLRSSDHVVKFRTQCKGLLQFANRAAKMRERL